MQVILLILAANAAVGVITETNAERALEVSYGLLIAYLNTCKNIFNINELHLAFLAW